jgi:arylsulfatase A-like enzyme
MYDPADIALPRNWRDALKDKPSTMRAIRRATRMEDLDEETFRRALVFYYGKISYIDALTGQVLDALKSRDLLDSSIVVFMGDHGDFAGEFGLFGKNGLLYDALTHVPLIIHAPQQVQNAVQVSTPVAHVDLVPTLLSMAGMDVPRELPGRDLTPVMAGDQDAAQAHGPVFCSSHGTLDPTLPYDCAWEEENLTPLSFDPYSTGPVQGWTSVMVRDGAYKCIAYSNGFRELFDMHNDPWERTNLSGREDYRAIETTLMHRLLSWQMDTWKPQIPQQGLPYHFRSFCRRRIPVSFQPLWDAWQAAHANG